MEDEEVRGGEQKVSLMTLTTNKRIEIKILPVVSFPSKTITLARLRSCSVSLSLSLPLLTGEAQVAAQQLPVANLMAYDDLKRAILQRFGRNPVSWAGGQQSTICDGPTAPLTVFACLTCSRKLHV